MTELPDCADRDSDPGPFRHLADALSDVVPAAFPANKGGRQILVEFMPYRLATVRLSDWQESNLPDVISPAFARKTVGNK